MTVSRLRPYATTVFAEMSALAARVGAVDLGQGFPDEDGPPSMMAAARDAIAAGTTLIEPCYDAYSPVGRDGRRASGGRAHGPRRSRFRPRRRRAAPGRVETRPGDSTLTEVTANPLVGPSAVHPCCRASREGDART